LKLVNYTILYF